MASCGPLSDDIEVVERPSVTKAVAGAEAIQRIQRRWQKVLFCHLYRD